MGVEVGIISPLTGSITIVSPVTGSIPIKNNSSSSLLELGSGRAASNGISSTGVFSLVMIDGLLLTPVVVAIGLGSGSVDGLLLTPVVAAIGLGSGSVDGLLVSSVVADIGSSSVNRLLLSTVVVSIMM